MRMWGVDPKVLCDVHLRGEHVEMHMFVGTIRQRKSIDGYIENGLIDTDKIKRRHDILAEEMILRGMNHESPLEYEDKLNVQSIDVEENLKELARRCIDCRDLQQDV